MKRLQKPIKPQNITYWYSTSPQYDILAIPTPVESYIGRLLTKQVFNVTFASLSSSLGRVSRIFVLLQGPSVCGTSGESIKVIERSCQG